MKFIMLMGLVLGEIRGAHNPVENFQKDCTTPPLPTLFPSDPVHSHRNIYVDEIVGAVSQNLIKAFRDGVQQSDLPIFHANLKALRRIIFLAKQRFIVSHPDLKKRLSIISGGIDIAQHKNSLEVFIRKCEVYRNLLRLMIESSRIQE